MLIRSQNPYELAHSDPCQLVGSRVFEQVDAARDSRSIVTDAGSTKGSVIRDIVALGSTPSWFVPGHPIAGSEQSGVDAANPDLYVDHQVILTPDLNTAADAIDLVSSLENPRRFCFSNGCGATR